MWKLLNPPTTEESIVERWYACVYMQKKKEVMFIAKAKMRFLFNKDGPIDGLELECLKQNVGVSNILESPPELRRYFEVVQKVNRKNDFNAT